MRPLQKLYRYIFLSVFLTGLFTFVSATPAAAQLTEIMRRMELHNQALGSVKASIAMSKCDAALNTCDKLSGSTRYIPERVAKKLYVRIDWSSPAEEHISIIGSDYELWRPRLNQVIYGTVQKAKSSSSAGNALAFMNMNRAQLRENYDVVYIGPESLSDGAQTQTWHLQLTPKGAASYKLAELWVDGDGMPRQGKITEKNNDTSTVMLSGIEKNIRLDAKKEFKLNYPSSVRRVPG